MTTRKLVRPEHSPAIRNWKFNAADQARDCANGNVPPALVIASGLIVSLEFDAKKLNCNADYQNERCCC